MSDTNSRAHLLPETLEVRGAREHNLRGVDVDLPHRNLTVFTGVSGSGKSSLAFATIYAEGQRRQLQSMSTFARQFMHQMDKPDVDHIGGLCSAVAVDQRSSASRSPRSTVGTVTEVYDLLRVVFARIGHPHCTVCGTELAGDACPQGHDSALPEMTNGAFSFNLPFGQCTACQGVGTRLEVDPTTLVADPGRSLLEGAITPWRPTFTEPERMKARAVAQLLGEDEDTPWEELSEGLRHTLLHGTDIKVRARKFDKPGDPVKDVVFTGVVPWLYERYRKSGGENFGQLENYMRPAPCRECGGGRLNPAQLAVRVAGRGIAEVTALPVSVSLRFFQELDVAERERAAVGQALEEIVQRLGHLTRMGLEYLSLDRPARTLSGGESQRIRLAGLLGTDMFGLLYVLDEPTTGLHPRDIEKLVATLQDLRDQGNTVLIVEHDHQMIKAADWVVELGPAAGEHGGELLFSGPAEQLLGDPDSPTGGYTSGTRGIAVPASRRPGAPDRRIAVYGAKENNLAGFDVAFPLGTFIAVTGVSGAGKSTLVDDILYPAVEGALGGDAPAPGAHTRIEGLHHVDRVIRVDQAPIGRSGRSTPATYTGVFDSVRKVFCQTAEAKKRRYKPGRFSFNSAGGRCETCTGDGSIKIEMQLLPDVFLHCETCDGTRYNAETLEIRYRGKNIAEVLAMPVEEALEFFAGEPAIEAPLRVLDEVGLGYLRLGQSATTLSGGEAQRVKLANELQRRAGAHTLYLLDEPTTGLHSSDIERLLSVLHSLVDKGHTVLAVSHNLDLIKTADWVVDIGPEGGDGGGALVAAGTPEQVAGQSDGHTGRFLRDVLGTSGRP
ncbi:MULTISPECIES: excinuclease ABC subunit UvrA [unclassified Streptomyces]|uniref:excinuclease ABC subunit UvrA n=1 Tax=Streptomyces sp. Root264 TaxID=1736503 RepID=UPI000ADCDBF1|nr:MULTISPECIES: excinuclease ABC subunit UvrA [unclassified Streptomyces]